MSQWSVYVTNHPHGSNAELGEGSYAIDHSKLAESAKSIHDSHWGNAEIVRNNPGYEPTRSSFTRHPRERDANMRLNITTPEGNRVAEYDADKLLSGRIDADELRKNTNEAADRTKQSNFETHIRTFMANRGSLPHSGVDALAHGVPTATSPMGAHISAGFEGGYQKSGYRFPHHSGRDFTRGQEFSGGHEGARR